MSQILSRRSVFVGVFLVLVLVLFPSLIAFSQTTDTTACNVGAQQCLDIPIDLKAFPSSTVQATQGIWVGLLQRFLVRQGLLDGKVMKCTFGDYEGKTQVAVKAFQVKTGLISSTDTSFPNVGVKTRAKIKALTCGTTPGESVVSAWLEDPTGQSKESFSLGQGLVIKWSVAPYRGDPNFQTSIELFPYGADAAKTPTIRISRQSTSASGNYKWTVSKDGLFGDVVKSGRYYVYVSAFDSQKGGYVVGVAGPVTLNLDATINSPVINLLSATPSEVTLSGGNSQLSLIHLMASFVDTCSVSSFDQNGIKINDLPGFSSYGADSLESSFWVTPNQTTIYRVECKGKYVTTATVVADTTVKVNTQSITVTTEKTLFDTGENVIASWSNALTGSSKDWVGLIKLGESYQTGIVTTPGSYAYTGGAASGKVTLTPPSPITWGSNVYQQYQVIYFLAGNTSISDLKEAGRSTPAFLVLNLSPYVDITAGDQHDLLTIAPGVPFDLKWISKRVITGSCQVVVSYDDGTPSVTSPIEGNVLGGGPTAITKAIQVKIQCTGENGVVLSKKISIKPGTTAFFIPQTTGFPVPVGIGGLNSIVAQNNSRQSLLANIFSTFTGIEQISSTFSDSLRKFFPSW